MSAARYFNPSLRKRILEAQEPTWLQRHPRRSYIIAAVLAAPAWVDRKAMAVFYEEARVLTAATGIRHVVDHIIPLTHPHVCGLHVPWNFRVVPWRVNATKGNRFSPDQLELFPT